MTDREQHGQTPHRPSTEAEAPRADEEPWERDRRERERRAAEREAGWVRERIQQLF
jgi:hypothetical protein